MRKSIFFFIFVLLGTVSIVVAQVDVCATVAEEALASVDELCAPMARNAACYGSNEIESTTVADPRPENFFVNPGDKEELVAFTQIAPQAPDLDERTLGVAALNIQANVPNTLPGQAVLFLLVGDARLTNEVELGSEEQTPFQSFYFLPGVSEIQCYESEPILTIQTPGGTTTTMVFNGVETEFSPGTLLTITPTVCTIHRGNIIRPAGSGNALLANETVDIFIDEEGAINVTGKRGISEREFERGEQIQNTLNAFAKANGWAEQLVNEPKQFAEEPEASDGEAQTAPEASSDCDMQHTVAGGESLHKIAERYETSVLAIAQANSITDYRVIQAGQVLCIPDVGTGFEPLPIGL